MWGPVQGLQDWDTGALGFGQAPSTAQEHPQIWVPRDEAAAQSRQHHASSLLQPCCPCPSWVALGMGHMGPGRSPLPLGTWHTLGWARWPSKQELCPPALSPLGHRGLRGRGLQGRNGATPMLPAPNRKQAPSSASTSAPDLLAGASGATRDGSGWGCGQGCAPPRAEGGTRGPAPCAAAAGAASSSDRQAPRSWLRHGQGTAALPWGDVAGGWLHALRRTPASPEGAGAGPDAGSHSPVPARGCPQRPWQGGAGLGSPGCSRAGTLRRQHSSTGAQAGDKGHAPSSASPGMWVALVTQPGSSSPPVAPTGTRHPRGGHQ